MMMKKFKQARSKIIITALIVPFFYFGCRKDKDNIPYVNVYFDISLTDPSFVDLNAVGGWVYVTGGVRGIIIYRKSIDEFNAYERNCTYQPRNDCARVVVDSTNISMSDPCCGSMFQIIDGNVLKGPASQQLLQYQTTLNGSILHVQN